MTADHPTLDTLADYLAGLQSPDKASEITSHLAQCTSCTANAEAVRQVPAILSDAASVPAPMPEPVWRDLDSALRREGDARAQAPDDLAGRRAAKQRAPARRTAWSLLAAAAAVVAVAGGVEMASKLGGSDSTTVGSAEAPVRPHSESATSSAGKAARKAVPLIPRQSLDKLPQPRQLSPRNLSHYAGQLAATQPRLKSSPRASNPATLGSRCATPDTSALDIVATSRWEGTPAIIIVDPRTRHVQVLDCRTASVLLYSASY